MGLIGKAFTEICAQYGANVVILDIPNTKPEEYAIKLEKRFSRSMLGISMDVSNRSEVKKSLDIILENFNKVSDLVNCHHNKSKSFFTKFEDYLDKEWAEIIDTNLNGTFLTCQIIGGWMVENGGGNIVNLPSLYSVVAPNQKLYKGTTMGSPAAYGASKGGIMTLSNYLASYWADKGVRVNQLTPHGVWNKHEKEFEDRFKNFLPLERMSYNYEIAGALLYLISDASSFVTGHNLIVDGGWSLW
jgi:NAD(P)-dependent dehydrogenase (short-subunit alcohol dehydrogenase family)